MNKTPFNREKIRNRETLNRTTIHYFKQLPRNTFATSWLRFFTTVIILFCFAFVLHYFLKLNFPIVIITLIVVIWFKARLNRIKKMKDLAGFKIPDYIWFAFRQRHAEISQSSYQHIEDGFKDYLALHIWQKQAYAMPSHSVDALWHLLIEEYPEFYRQMCIRFLNYELKHKPHDQTPTAAQRSSQKTQLANTWHSACHLHQLDPRNTQILPRLFQVDSHIKWEHGLIFSLPFLISMYEQMIGATSIIPNESTTSSGSTSCTSSTTSCSSSSCSGSSSESNQSSDSSDSSTSSCSSCSSCGGGGGD